MEGSHRRREVGKPRSEASKGRYNGIQGRNEEGTKRRKK